MSRKDSKKVARLKDEGLGNVPTGDSDNANL